MNYLVSDILSHCLSHVNIFVEYIWSNNFSCTGLLGSADNNLASLKVYKLGLNQTCQLFSVERFGEGKSSGMYPNTQVVVIIVFFGLGIHIYIGNCYDNYEVLPCYSFMFISNTDCLSFEDYLCRVETLKHLNREIETDRQYDLVVKVLDKQQRDPETQSSLRHQNQWVILSQ